MEVRGVIPQVLETVINFLFPFCVLFLLYVKFTLVVLLLNWISKVFHLSSHFLCNKGIRGDKTAEWVRKPKRKANALMNLHASYSDHFVVAQWVLFKNSNDITNMYIFVHYVLRKRPVRSEVNSWKRELPEGVFTVRWVRGNERGASKSHSIVCHQAVWCGQMNRESRDTLLLIGQYRLTAPAQHMAMAASWHFECHARQDDQYLP